MINFCPSNLLRPKQEVALDPCSYTTIEEVVFPAGDYYPTLRGPHVDSH